MNNNSLSYVLVFPIQVIPWFDLLWLSLADTFFGWYFCLSTSVIFLNMVTSLQVPYTRNHSKEPEEEMYSAENFRRIARSLSGTVIANREETLVSSHSFVSSLGCLFTFLSLCDWIWNLFFLPYYKSTIYDEVFLLAVCIYNICSEYCYTLWLTYLMLYTTKASFYKKDIYL